MAIRIVEIAGKAFDFLVPKKFRQNLKKFGHLGMISPPCWEEHPGEQAWFTSPYRWLIAIP